MNIQKITLLCIVSCMVVITSAADRIHGVGGYYYFSPKQLKAENKLTTANGVATTWNNNGWRTSLSYYDDYVKINMGVNNAAPGKTILADDGVTVLSNLWPTRTDVGMKETLPGQGSFTVTKDFPVVAMKIAVPIGNDRIDGNDYIEIPLALYDRDTRALYHASGFDANNRLRVVPQIYPYRKDSQGMDSLTLYRRTEPVNGVDGYVTVETFRVVDNGASWIVFYVDLTPQFVTDTRPIDVNNFGCMFFTQSDTAKTTAVWNEEGDQIISRLRLDGAPAKTRDEFATTYIKWIGTFASSAEVIDLIDNYNGDNPLSASKMALDGKIYEMKEFIKGYKFADASALDVFNAALADAQTLSDTPAPGIKGSPEYIAWEQSLDAEIDILLDVQKTFLVAISMVPKDIYNNIISLDGMYGITLGETKTIGAYTGQVLAVGPASNAAGFMVKALADVNGQKAYSLSTAQGTVTIVNDTLLLIPTAKVTATNPANFIFSNRYTLDEPAYDMMVNGNYFYITDMAKLDKTKSLPDAQSIDDLVRYLFDISAATYDPSGDDPNMVLNGWEFNSPAAYSSETDPFPNEEPFISYLPQWQDEFTRVDGWARIRYQMQSQISQQTHKDAGCLVIQDNDTYYANSDLTFAGPLNQTSYPSTALLGREHGTYNTNWTEPTTSRDSTFIVYLNTYYKRYLAMKWESNNPDVRFTRIVFQALKTVDEPTFTPDNLMGRKGDVYYWDMLQTGIPYGTKGYMGQFLMFENFTGPDDQVYVDWIRTYASIDDIPNESFTNIENVNAQLPIQIYSAGKTIHVNNLTGKNAEVTIYGINGMKIAGKTIGQTTTMTIPVGGFYLVSVKAENEKAVTAKLVIR